MKLLSIEPTPSPNTMKLNVDEKLKPGERYTYTDAAGAPGLIARLLAIPGVKSVFRTADFIAIDRRPNADWAAILNDVREVFGAAGEAGVSAGPEAAGFGEARVLVQLYRGIPIQVRVRSGGEEFRAAMPERFERAVREAAGATMIRERRLEELGVRYGEPQDILQEIVQELEASYPEDRLRDLVEKAKAAGPEPPPPEPPAPVTAEEAARALESPDWQVRYNALARLKAEPEHLPLLAKAVADPHVSVRRLAVVLLGDLRSPEAMPHLFTALRDPSPAVRRTAGDTLSDLGDPAAIGPMTEALSDPNKLVRWRAARFMYEVGDESALEALERLAANEPEFEVRLQAEMAIARIRSGEEAAGTVWQQMTRARQAERQSRDGADEAKRD
jgi:hypothetical protein